MNLPVARTSVPLTASFLLAAALACGAPRDSPTPPSATPNSTSTAAQIPHSGLDATAVEQPDAQLKTATAIAEWIESTRIDDAGYLAWPDDATDPNKYSDSLGTGTAGRIIFFVALFRASGERRYLDIAEEAARTLQLEPSDNGPLKLRSSPRPEQAHSLYTGLAGTAFALLQLRLALARERVSDIRLDDLSIVHARLIDAATDGSAGLEWSSSFNDLTFGDAGTALYLAYAGHLLGDESLLRAARQGAHAIAARGIPEHGGLYWRFRRDKPFNLPNFSHGAAGIGYVLATIGGCTGDSELIAAAESARRYLDAIALREAGIYALPYGWPIDDWKGVYGYGWAHGVSGTARFFERMHQVTGDSSAALRVRELAEALVVSGLPSELRAPLAPAATELDMRFGRAGALMFSIEMAARDQQSTRFADLRDTLAEHIVAKATVEEGKMFWTTTPPAFMAAGETAKFTGYFHGAAGMGLSFLRQRARRLGLAPYMQLPDDPFAWTLGPAESTP